MFMLIEGGVVLVAFGLTIYLLLFYRRKIENLSSEMEIPSLECKECSPSFEKGECSPSFEKGECSPSFELKECFMHQGEKRIKKTLNKDDYNVLVIQNSFSHGNLILPIPPTESEIKKSVFYLENFLCTDPDFCFDMSKPENFKTFDDECFDEIYVCWCDCCFLVTLQLYNTLSQEFNRILKSGGKLFVRDFYSKKINLTRENIPLSFVENIKENQILDFNIKDNKSLFTCLSKV